MQPIDARRQALSASKAALLDRLLGAGVRMNTAPAGLTRLPPGAPLPLSPQQRQLWTDKLQITPLYEGPPPRNQTVCLALNGPLDVDAFRRALEALIQRHEPLRMDFPADETEAPRVRVAERISLELPITEVLEGSPEQRQAAAIAIARADEMAPFDLQNGPLFRIRLFRLGETHHLLFFLIDHIAFDGWSFGIFLSELSTLYAADAAATLPPLPVRYADYAHSETLRLTPAYIADALAFWRELLGDLGLQPDLATSPRTSPQPFRLAQAPVAMDGELAARAVAFSRAQGLSLFATLLASFKLTIWRRCGICDIAVVSQAANRMDPAVQGLIGKFANSVATRTRIDGARSFCECAHLEFQGLMRSLAHQDFPYSTLGKRLFPDGDPIRLSFGLQNYPMPPLRLADLELRPVYANFGASLREIAVTLFQDSAAIHGTVSFNAALYGEAAIEGLFEGYYETLRRALARPDEPVAGL